MCWLLIAEEKKKKKEWLLYLIPFTFILTFTYVLLLTRNTANQNINNTC